MKTAISRGLLVVLSCTAFAEETPAQGSFRALTEALELIEKSVVSLQGRISTDADNSERIWTIVALRLKNHPDLAGVFGNAVIKARRSGEANQQQVFLDALLDIACKNFEDGCQLKRDVAALLSKDREQDERLDRLDQILGELREDGPIRHQRYYRGPSEPQPTPASRVWRYGVDRITHRRGVLCPSATLIETNVYLPVARGHYRGDVYQNCSGRIVLVRLD